MSTGSGTGDSGSQVERREQTAALLNKAADDYSDWIDESDPEAQTSADAYLDGWFRGNKVNAAAEERLAAVLALHVEICTDLAGTHCEHDGNRWPCATAQAAGVS